MKKIYTILTLLFNFLIRRKHYTLRFVSESQGPADNPKLVKLWYYDFKYWGFSHDNLLMVFGADDLCEWYSEDGETATVEIIASRKELKNKYLYDHFVAEDPIVFATNKINKLLDKIIFGRSYKEDISPWKKSGSHAKPRHFWICPVTLFVLGRYPKHI